MRLAIVGCGPAGMLAAHACFLEGVEFEVFSNVDQPSLIGGAQYLHEFIPGIEIRPGKVDYKFVGDRQGYHIKAHGGSLPGA
jgi:hypothetical protein